MIFFDQFKVPMIKFGKCFAEFMIRIIISAAKLVMFPLSSRQLRCNINIVYTTKKIVHVQNVPKVLYILEFCLTVSVSILYVLAQTYQMV